MSQPAEPYVHALRFRWLTPFYDAIVAATTREETFRAAVIAQAGLRPDQRVLDLGCGTGTLAISMALACPGISIVGLDGDREILAEAERKANAAGAPVEWRWGLATALNLPDDSFDRVLSTLFFHHLRPAEKIAAAREAYRVLRPGGEMHLADWGPPTSRAQRVLHLPVQLLDGFANTSPQQAGVLSETFRTAGFEDVRLRRQIPTPLGTIALYSARKSARQEKYHPEGQAATTQPDVESSRDSDVSS